MIMEYLVLVLVAVCFLVSYRYMPPHFSGSKFKRDSDKQTKIESCMPTELAHYRSHKAMSEIGDILKKKPADRIDLVESWLERNF